MNKNKKKKKEFVVIKIKYRQKSRLVSKFRSIITLNHFVILVERIKDCTTREHITLERFPPTYCAIFFFHRFYAKHSRMKMFKFRPRRVSGIRRSEAFWRVVVSIFIFRNPRNILIFVFFSFFFGTFCTPSDRR